MYTELSKPLTIEQIDFRIQSINTGKYATILAYKSARVDMDTLDKVVGRGYWQRHHQSIDGRLYCTISIYNQELKQWIEYQDVGTESNTEKEKGQASDSFKRACFNLGIGRELYNYPVIQIKLNDDEVYTGQDGKPRQSFNLNLKDWIWYSEFDDNNQLSYLGCKDTKGTIRYQWGKLKQNSLKQQEKGMQQPIQQPTQPAGDFKEMLSNYNQQEFYNNNPKDYK